MTNTHARMPSLFIAHGSPMNAIGDHDYGKRLNQLGQSLPTPKAILMISAHWRTRDLQVLHHPNPPTIHDFSGFPPELYAVSYPAPGATAVAERVCQLLRPFAATTTEEWGLDHGMWSVLRHLFPAADIPVTALSLEQRTDLAQHLAIAKQLRPLRDEGVLIIGSGNITHNLGELDWSAKAPPMDWAVAFDTAIRDAIESRHIDTLTNFAGIDPSLRRRALPTLEHYIPLLYAIGPTDPGEKPFFFYDEMQHGSLSMRSLQVG